MFLNIPRLKLSRLGHHLLLGRLVLPSIILLRATALKMESGGGVGGAGAKPARPGSARPGGRPQSAVPTPGGAPGLLLLPFYLLLPLFPGWRAGCTLSLSVMTVKLAAQ
jgi:hypothetical protein